jgi:uroporphyrin-III C-methyltransferase
MKAKLTLVGAGPGDPDLISLKGINALKSADAVLYDALAHPDLLEYCSEQTTKIFVGKRAGIHSYQQQQINQMIVENALPDRQVVRLKGGDPFIFGRGQEEIEYAETFGIETAVVPGISSINLPGHYGIPLTVRGVNESFWVVTATTSAGAISDDLKLAAQSNATIVVFMGLKKLAKIVEVFKDAGKPSLPIAVISRGTLPQSSLLMGTVNNIEEKVKREKPVAPALLIIGKTVAMNPQFCHQSNEIRTKLLEAHG